MRRDGRRYTPEGYRQWRATLPWTDEEFEMACLAEAAASPTVFLRQRYEQWAGLARRGWICGFMLRVAIPRLVKRCALCGKKALYRLGNEGRCRTHRDVAERYTAARQQRFAAKAAEVQAQHTSFDDRDLSTQSLRQTRKVFR